VLGLGSLEYAVLSTGALVCAVILLLDHYPAQRAVTLSWAIGVPAGTALALLAVRYRTWICRGRLGRIAARLSGNAVHVPWSEVESVSSVVKLKRPAAELRLGGGDRRWSGLVGKLPGA
jgi:hypothetical protein